MVKKTSNSVYREAFSPATENQQRIGCLVYPESTQISERSLYKLVKGSLDF